MKGLEVMSSERWELEEVVQYQRTKLCRVKDNLLNRVANFS